jgi:hypothetical protein
MGPPDPLEHVMIITVACVPSIKDRRVHTRWMGSWGRSMPCRFWSDAISREELC